MKYNTLNGTYMHIGNEILFKVHACPQFEVFLGYFITF